jgi:hypothetical protein
MPQRLTTLPTRAAQARDSPFRVNECHGGAVTSPAQDELLPCNVPELSRDAERRALELGAVAVARAALVRLLIDCIPLNR